MKSKEEISKAIALFKLENPKATIANIAKRFKVKNHVARYAVDRYANDTEFLKLNKKSRNNLSKKIAEKNEDIILLRNQLSLAIAQLQTDNKMPLKSRVDLLSKVMRIKVQLSNVELESHLKRADAAIIAGIIKRFLPGATNEDVIKIYNEELTKVKNE